MTAREETHALMFSFFEKLLEQNRRHVRPSDPSDRDAAFEREASRADDRHQAEKESF